MKISGIYKIINKVNGKYYVGSSNDIKIRWARHKTLLNHNKHPNSYLQYSWNKYGESNFDFIIAEKIPNDNLLIVEQKYLDLCNNDKNISYNMSNDTKSTNERKTSY